MQGWNDRTRRTERAAREKESRESQTECIHLSSLTGAGVSTLIFPHTVFLLAFFFCFCSLHITASCIQSNLLSFVKNVKTCAGSSNRFDGIGMHRHAQRRLFQTGHKFDVTLMTSVA